jgi:holo-[acyl-carrier protein] synthase
MALAGIGVDMLEIARMERTLARRPSFVCRVFTDDERAYCESRTRPAEHYAACFAAREAVVKALGAEFSHDVGIHDVSVSYDDDGRSHAVLTGRAAELARAQGVREIALSLSYTHEVAVANAVAVTDEVRPREDEKPDPERELARSFKEARSVIDELERAQNGITETTPEAEKDADEDADEEQDATAIEAPVPEARVVADSGPADDMRE